MDTDYSKQYAALRLLADSLVEVCACNIDLRDTAPSPFDAISEPPMLVHDYFVRIRRYTKFDFNCFFVAVWYLRTLAGKDPMFCMTKHNVHRLLITAVTVAAKASDDVYHANSFMARCGGISLAELNALELELCTQLDWKLVCGRAEMEQLTAALMREEASLYWNAFLNVQGTNVDEAQGAPDDDSDCGKSLSGEESPCEIEAPLTKQKGKAPKSASKSDRTSFRPAAALEAVSAWPSCLRRSMNQWVGQQAATTVPS